MAHAELPPLSDVILRLAGVCERTGTHDAVGGAVAANFWGLPRTTQDADLLVSVPAVTSQRSAFHRHKDIQDVRGILAVQNDRLDLVHLRVWAGRTLDDAASAELDRLIDAAGMA